jgi:hypothetical protein
MKRAQYLQLQRGDQVMTVNLNNEELKTSRNIEERKEVLLKGKINEKKAQSKYNNRGPVLVVGLSLNK